MLRSRLVLATLLCLCLSPLAFAQNYTSILVFGDSLSDTGNFAKVVQGQFGVRVPGPLANYTDGRFTDGTLTSPAAVNYNGVWIEQVAATLPAKPAVTDSLDGGNNYAYGFASTGDGTSIYTTTVTLGGAPIPISITVKNIGQQVLDFLSTTPAVPANTLVVVWGGANDLLGAAAASGATQTTIQTAITTAVTAELTDVQRLIAAGAKNILVPNLPPLGNIPRLNGTPYMPIANGASVAFNTALKAGLASLQTPGVTINQLDIYTLFTAAIAAPTTAGFTNVTASAQGVTGINPDTYLFWDDLHPTTGGHHSIALAAESLIAPSVATTTVLTSSAATATVGTSITFTANVTAASGTASPTGNVTFYDGATQLNVATFTTNGSTTSTTTFSTTALTAGTHTITAVYAGSTGFSTSTSNAVTETITVPAINTTTTLTSSATTANTGVAITFTAKVAAATGTPAGTVTFLDGATSIGTGTLASGSATLTTSSLTLGTHTITASYAATAGFLGSTSNTVTETITTPLIAFQLSPTTLTLTAGSSGSSMITFTPSNGYAGTITLGCGALPSMATCVLSPATLTFSAGSSAVQTAKVNISTNSKTPATALLLFPISALGMLFALRRRRSNPGLFLLILILSGAGLLGFTGCGGGTPAAPITPSTTTPTGTYTVPISVSPSSGIATNLNLTLVVQ